jgi:small subunit ribosomal protein S19
MSRSKWKGPFIHTYLLKSRKKLYIWSRDSVITNKFLNKNVLVHNGKEFKKIFITREKIGFKFGQFSFTKKYIKKVKKTVNNKKSS